MFQPALLVIFRSTKRDPHGRDHDSPAYRVCQRSLDLPAARPIKWLSVES